MATDTAAKPKPPANRPASNPAPAPGGKRFDPSKYETVSDRIKRFYSDHADGRIIADIISDLREPGTVVVKAKVFLTSGDQRDNLPKGTGLASEVAATDPRGGANFGSHIENCETSAIGRALASAGYSETVERASREEMESKERYEQQQQQRAQAPAPAVMTPREQRAQEARQARLNAPQEEAAPADQPPADQPPEAPAGGRYACNQCGKELTNGQYTVSLQNFGVSLCPVHQAEAKRGLLE